jgi:hypothetical protein
MSSVRFRTLARLCVLRPHSRDTPVSPPNSRPGATRYRQSVLERLPRMGGLELASLTIVSTRTCGAARSRERARPAKVASFVAFPALLLAFVVALLLTLLPVLRGGACLAVLCPGLAPWVPAADAGPPLAWGPHRLVARGGIGCQRRHRFHGELGARCRGCRCDSQQRDGRGDRRLGRGSHVDGCR